MAKCGDIAVASFCQRDRRDPRTTKLDRPFSPAVQSIHAIPTALWPQKGFVEAYLHSPSPKAEALQCGAQAQDINTGEYVMVYRGQIQGNVVVLKECPSVPDGTEVEVLVPGTEASTTPVQGEHSVASRTFGLIPADLTTVRAVIEEDLYEAE